VVGNTPEDGAAVRNRVQFARSMSIGATWLLCMTCGSVYLGTSGSASGSVALPSVVSTNPANFTPHVVDGGGAGPTEIFALARRGRTMYAGGHFAAVQNARRTTTFDRSNLMSFSARTGAVRALAPEINGEVLAVRPVGRFLFIGGRFTTVNGQRRRSIAKINAVTGRVDPVFNPRLNGDVTDIRMVRSRLVVAGHFSRSLVALNPRSGSARPYIRARIAGTVARNAGRVGVTHFAVNSARTRLLAVGNFRTVRGRARQRAFMLNLGARRTRLNPWRYRPLAHICRQTAKPDYLRDVDFSPNGRYFVIVSTGSTPRAGGTGRDVCDAAARFETAIKRPRRPTWINYSGGDTLHSVAATGSVVYVQGHMRSVNNPLVVRGRRARAGRITRSGIAALDSANGRALSWNPGKTRGIGGKEFLATRAGLWVGSDGARFGGEIHDNIAFCRR
jgi:hypothetical protein